MFFSMAVLAFPKRIYLNKSIIRYEKDQTKKIFFAGYFKFVRFEQVTCISMLTI